MVVNFPEASDWSLSETGGYTIQILGQVLCVFLATLYVKHLRQRHPIAKKNVFAPPKKPFFCMLTHLNLQVENYVFYFKNDDTVVVLSTCVDILWSDKQSVNGKYYSIRSHILPKDQGII